MEDNGLCSGGYVWWRGALMSQAVDVTGLSLAWSLPNGQDRWLEEYLVK